VTFYAYQSKSFAVQSLIQFRLRLQSCLMAAIVSKLRYFVEVWTQGMDLKD
jgi:hypothetical protein